jgi:2-polyprenyl-6-methoxyphenol hydroxylase-like FAD-dependent oxidoreductase
VALTTAVIGAGPAGLLFSLLGKIVMGEGWTVRLYDKRESYARTHRLRLAPEVYAAIQQDLHDPRFDRLMDFCAEHRFSPEINALEATLTELVGELGVVKTVREITSLDDLAADTIVGADSVHSTVRELVRGHVRPTGHTHERVARLRVTGDDLPARLSVLDQFRLSKVLGSLVDYRLNRNGFAELDLFLADDEHALVRRLGASPKQPVPITARDVGKLEGPMLRAVVAQMERGGRRVEVYSTFELEHVVMPRVSFECAGRRVFLLGDAAVSLPFFRGMACLAACAHSLARAHASGHFEAYEREVAEIVRREVTIVRARAQFVRGLRELVRVSSLLPFPIQSWWVSAARDPEPDHASPSAAFNLLVAAFAGLLASAGLLRPWISLLAFPAQAAGGIVYRWTLRLEPGPHRYVRRIWEIEMAILFVGILVLVATKRASFALAIAWWILGAAFAVGIYLFEWLVGRRLARANVDRED